VLRLPRVHVFGLADETDVAGHLQHQERAVEEADVIRAQDGGTLVGKWVESVKFELPQMLGDRAYNATNPSLCLAGPFRIHMPMIGRPVDTLFSGAGTADELRVSPRSDVDAKQGCRGANAVTSDNGGVD